MNRLAIPAVLIGLVALWGCDNGNGLDDVGDDIEEGAEEIEDDVDDAIDEVGDELDDNDIIDDRK
jgi:hypothetical protein